MPGKFEAWPDQSLAERLYNITLDGGILDMGSVQTGDWYGLILDDEETGQSYIVHEDDQGFFSIEGEYESAQEAKDAWDELLDEHLCWAGESFDDLP